MVADSWCFAEPVAAAAYPALGRRALRPVPVAAPAAIPEPLPAPPVLDLPPFPILDVADIGVEFTFDQSGFPEAWTHEEVAPAADVALRLRYAELRLRRASTNYCHSARSTTSSISAISSTQFGACFAISGDASCWPTRSASARRSKRASR